MPTNIGPRIGIEGESEYRSAINNIIQQGKTLDSQMKALTSSFDQNTSAEERNQKTSELLNQQIQVQKERVKLLSQMLEESAQKYGENDTKTLKWQQAVADATAELNRMEQQGSEASGEVEELGNTTETASEKTLSFSDVLKANLLSEAIIGGFKALGKAAVDAAKKIATTFTDTVQWADDLATLSVQTGLSTQALQEYEYMAGLIDTDVSTITGSLTKLTANMNGAKDGTGAAADAFAALGVAVTNEDGTLRSSQEVFDQVIDALGSMTNETERDATAMAIFGKSAQELNPLIAAGSDALANYRQEASDMGYVLDDEALGGLTAVSDGMERLKNAGTTIGRNLASALAPFADSIVTTAMPAVMDLVGAFQQLTAGEISIEQFLATITPILQSFVDTIVQNLPLIIDIAGQLIMSLAEGIIQNLPTIMEATLNILFAIVDELLNNLGTIMDAALSIILAIIDGITANLPQLLTTIVDVVVQLATKLTEPSTLMSIVRSALSLIQALVQGIVQALPVLIKAAPTIITNIVTALIQALPEILASGIDIIFALIDGLLQAIPDIIAAIPQIVTGIINAFKNVDWGSIGRNIMEGIKNGLRNMLSNLVNVVKDIAGSLINGAKKALGIGSPSKVFAELGEFTGEGMEIGLVGSLRHAAKAMKKEISALPASASVALNSMPGAGALNQNTYNNGGNTITVNAAPGQSAREIAEAVSEELNRQVRRRQEVFA